MENSSIRKQQDPFTMVPNHLTNNNSLSFKAKGVYCFLKSKPDGWVFYIDKIAESSKDGVSSVRSAIEELESVGYIVKEQIRDKEGRFTGTKIVVISNEKDLGRDIVIEEEEKVVKKKKRPKKERPSWIDSYDDYNNLIIETVREYHSNSEMKERFDAIYDNYSWDRTLRNVIDIMRTDSEYERAKKRWSKSKTGNLNWSSRVAEVMRWSGVKVWDNGKA